MTIETKFSGFFKWQQQAADENTTSDRLIEIARISTKLARLVALNPKASHLLLRELSCSEDVATRKNVTANPNTPIEILLNLGSEFPEELLNNSTFSQLLIENPSLVDIIPLNTLQSLVKYETVPVSFIERVVNQLDADTLLILAESAETTNKVLLQLVNSRYSEVSEAAKLHVNLAGEITSGWDEIGIEALSNSEICGQKFGDFLEELGKINLIPEFVIESLPENYSCVKNIPDRAASIGVEVEQLPKDNNLWLPLFLANNPNTPAGILEDLAQNNHVWLCQSLANNPNTPASVLQDLAKDSYRGVRQNVAKNPRTPASSLELLFSDCSEIVRRLAIARYLVDNPDGLSVVINHYPLEYSTPCFSRLIVLMHPQIPSKLVEKCGWLVWLERYAIAQNRNTSPALLKLLVKDSNRIVRAAAKANLAGSKLMHV